MEKKVYELKVSEALERVMPPLQELELDLLKQSLLDEGCREPLVVWNGLIVDGHNRYRICRENSIPFSFVEMEFEDESVAQKWIIRNQLARRNVPDFVRCEMVLPFEEELRTEAKKRQGTRTDLNNIMENFPESKEASTSRDELGKMAGVSGRTMVKAKKLIESADDDMKDKLRRGQISIHKAYTQLKGNQGTAHPEGQQDITEPDAGYEEQEWKPVVGKPGDILPGFRVERIPGQLEDGTLVPQPESVYDIPPIEVYGNMPSDDYRLRGNAELVHARSDLQTATDNYARRVAEIICGMSAASTNEKNMQVLRDIVAGGYDQILDSIKQKMNGGKKQ